LGGTLSAPARLFSESPSRIIVSFDQAALGKMEEIAAEMGCPLTILGRTGGGKLIIKTDGDEVINLSTSELENAWRTSLGKTLQAEVLAAGAE
jgi:phosphoribosylformylglycinamidine (FGAM) synthase-like enzyme